MLLSAVSVLVVAQSSSEIPEGLMNNPVQCGLVILNYICRLQFPVFSCIAVTQSRHPKFHKP